VPSFSFDPQQKQAIEHVHGPMLVVAGAGTGKTTVLVERVVSLIKKGHAQPGEILAVTFTENAARELRERVEAKLGAKVASQLQAKTFHAYCFGLLKRAHLDFTPLTREDLWVLLRRELKNLGLKYYIKAAKPGQFLNALLTFFDRCDDELVTAERYREYVEELKANQHPLPRVLRAKDAALLKPEEVIARCEEIARVFTNVNELLAAKNLGTFGHQISRAVRLLSSDPATLAEEQRSASFILIDEFQDSNVAQIRLAHLLAGTEQNVFAVGDPDQAIFRFRGATAGAFDHFEKQFANVRHVALEQNRRSLGPILRCAFQVIDRNPRSIHTGQLMRMPLMSARENAGEKGHAVELAFMPGEPGNATEAAEIADAIENFHANCPGHVIRGVHQPCSWKHTAILYRLHGHRDELARELSRRNIPILVRGVDVLDTPEVRDTLSVLRALANLGDNAALFRVASLPQFAIDPDELRAALLAAGRKENARLTTVLAKVNGGQAVLDAIQKARTRLAPDDRAVTALKLALKDFSLPDNEATQALSNFVEQWSEKPVTPDANLPSFLEYLDYYREAGGKICLPDPGDDVDAVQFMTAHIAKGLEFPHVFIVRACNGSFPGNYKEDLFEFPQALSDWQTTSGDEKVLHQEEERRLFYVGMTRARDTLALSAKRSRSKRVPTPPRFIHTAPTGPMREIAEDRTLMKDSTVRLAEQRITIHAGLEAASTVGEWMLLPPARDMQKLSLSASRIQNYEDCPLRFKIETDWNIPGEPVPAMQFGNAVHTALKAYNDSVKAARPLTLTDFLQVFTTQMDITFFDDPHQKQLYLEQGRRQLEAFHYLRNLEPVPHVLDTEHVFSVVIGGVKVVGRIDLAQRTARGGLAILDYKSGAPKDNDDAEKSLQLSIYALAAQQQWGEIPERIGFYNLETNDAVETTRSAEDLEDTRAKIMAAADAIQAGKFSPKRGFQCSWCAYRDLCPAQEEPLYTIAQMATANSND
jgi:superfamily I DNA/RNA helicase/RecB family exonuclease